MRSHNKALHVLSGSKFLATVLAVAPPIPCAAPAGRLPGWWGDRGRSRPINGGRSARDRGRQRQLR